MYGNLICLINNSLAVNTDPASLRIELMKPQTMSPVQTNGMNSEMGILKSRPYNNPSDKTMIAMLAVSQKGPSNERR